MINTSLYSDAFVVPGAVIRDHLKLVGLSQLKVLLWMLSHGGACNSFDGISDDTGLPISEISDAMQYWIDSKIVLTDSEKPEPVSVDDDTQTKVPTVKSSSQKPNRKEVVELATGDEDIKWLLNEASVKFSRTLSVPEMSSLVWMHANLGLPSEVVLMLVQYSISCGKGNIRYMEKLAVSWAENDLVTVDEAEKYLIALEKSRKNWSVVSKVLGISDRKPSEKEKVMVDRWINEWKFSVKMISAAYNRCVDNTGKFSMAYINKVLESWHSNGLKKVEDVEKFYEEGKSEKKSGKTRSYDISDIENLLTNNGDK